jgi:hypothetical protein
VTLFALVAVTLIAPSKGAAQGLYTPEPGPYLAVDLVGSLSLFETERSVRAGYRFAPSMDLGLRLNRVGAVAPLEGSQRPQRLGSTLVEALVGSTRLPVNGGVGRRFVTAASITVADSSNMAYSDSGYTFRTGPRIAEYGARVEALLFKSLGTATVQVFPTVGVFSEFRRYTERTVYYAGITNADVVHPAAQNLAVGLVLAIPASFELRPGHRIALEPSVRTDFHGLIFGGVSQTAVGVSYNF